MLSVRCFEKQQQRYTATDKHIAVRNKTNERLADINTSVYTRQT